MKEERKNEVDLDFDKKLHLSMHKGHLLSGNLCLKPVSGYSTATAISLHQVHCIIVRGLWLHSYRRNIKDKSSLIFLHFSIRLL